MQRRPDLPHSAQATLTHSQTVVGKRQVLTESGVLHLFYSFRQVIQVHIPRTHNTALRLKRTTTIYNKYSSATAEKPRELGDSKGVGHFEAKF